MTQEIVADFAIYASSTTTNWGSIFGNINEQVDLINMFNLKVDKTTTINGYSLSSNITLKISNLENDLDYLTRTQTNSLISVHNTSNDAHEDIRGLISTINNTLSTFGNIVTHNVSEFATSAQGSLADTALQPSDVVNNVVSTEINLPLSANMGKSLQDEIDTLKARGRFLALWNCATGLPETEPLENPYEYKAGDYYIVGTVGTTNYQPAGSEYIIGTPSTVLETQAVSVDDVYYYDGTNWKLQINTQKVITFAQIAGQPTDNSNLASALNDKVTKNNDITGATKCKITYDTKGLVTAGADLQAADIPSLTLSKISDITATASEINVLDGITATTTELNYVDGVTSAIQTQLNAKEPKANVTSKGTATLPVYFDSNAIAQTITSYEGNAATATKAAQDGNGNVIVDTYVNNERLNALPSYENYGYVQTESKGLEDLKKFNRSTFDLSKFTVVNSPTITDDGIASGFSNNDCFTKYLDFSTADSWEIQVPFTTSSDVTSHQRVIDRVTATENLIIIRVQNSVAGISLNVGGTDIFSINTDTFTVTTNTQYTVKIGYNGTSYYCKYNTGGADTTIKTVTSASLWGASVNHFIGKGSAPNAPFLGSIDLKQFSITVDGVEVFNGNKTGVDVIKADNFTKVGSPTISADGIASGFSTSNYLTSTQTFDFSNYSSWEITAKISCTSLANGQTIFNILYDSTTNTIISDVTTAGKVRFLCWSNPSGGLAGLLFNYTSAYTLSINTNYIIKFKFTGTSYQIGFSTDGENYTWETASNSATKSNATGYLQVGLTRTSAPFSGSIDLNELKVVVDGNLVYQPLLRIPYNQSKTGSKIVQYAYRDRVQDMYNQFSWANYYTLLEDKKPHYNVVGTPTISSDYVASGFSSSNYINYITSDFATADSWEFDLKFTTSSDVTTSQIVLGSYYSVFGLDLSLSSGALKIGLGSTGSNFNLCNQSLQNISVNTDYWVKIKFTGTHYVVDISTDGINYTNKLNLASTTKILSTVTGFALGMLFNNKTQIFAGSIDLKAFKVYLDNKLTYQAVEEPDFTLPYGENLDGHVTKVDWYKNGITTWEYDTNLDCIETGSCTSGTAVTLPKPMADDTYSLSVPYSAKSKTGFTPTATGDYIAKGKVVLG